MATDSVNIDSLDLQQLTQVKKQLGEELEHLSASFSQLLGAQSKFKECLRCVETRSAAANDPETQSVLVPLTNSLYIRGEMDASDKILVDVGTGFLVEKTNKDAAEFYGLKVDELGKNLQEIETALQQRTSTMQAVEESMFV